VNPNPVTRFYQVRVEKGHEWARIWITNDGCISIISDYGNFGYWFGSPGCEFRKFLTRCGDDYIQNKLSMGEEQLDQQATERAAKRLVLTNRRDKSLSREQARDEWDAVCAVEWDSEYSRCKWYFEETKLVDYGACEVLQYRTPMRVQMFVKLLWPLFVAALKAELAAEPTIDELLDASSLGTPEAKAIRAEADPKAVARVMQLLQESDLDASQEESP
jgi:hypothetical protein